MKYLANYLANCNTHYSGQWVFTNKRKAIEEIRRIANECRFADNECQWSVYAENGKCIAIGGTMTTGQMWRATEDELKWYAKW